MKQNASYFTCFFICIIYVATRLIYSNPTERLPIKVTTWDALGYYMYLPAQFIYHDEKELKWMHAIDSTYTLTGGELYQASKQSNGNYVNKYLEGVSILQLPFFFIAHYYALHSNYPTDGFSLPYQYAIAWGSLFYCLLSLFLIRTILKKYFDDYVVAWTILFLMLATNAIQYIAIEGGQSHAYIFPLYVLILFVTIKWHESKKWIWAFLIGLIIGLATVSRPTEAVMLFIPLLWNLHSKESSQNKWTFLKQNKSHFVLLILGGSVGILPQLLYWKRVTGSYIFDVGSKWDFLNPHFRVLLGFEKGWFIYTPITLFFIVGLFFINNKSYSKSIITFCILNIYIIIAWHIWRYGGSYSTRALVQSYPIFAFPLAGFIQFISFKKWHWLIIFLGIYFILVNLFQIKQYNRNILHYDDMNFDYYKAIYLNPNPSPLDMSLLDTEDMVKNESEYKIKLLYTNDSIQEILSGQTVWFSKFNPSKTDSNHYLKISCSLNKTTNAWNEYIFFNQIESKIIKQTKVRITNPLFKENNVNQYCFFVKLEPTQNESELQLRFDGNNQFKALLTHLKIEKFDK